MSFILNGIDRFELSNLSRQFSDFLNNDDKLPFCRINFYENPGGLFSEAKQIKQVGSFLFYECNDGVLISDRYFFVHSYNSFNNIDVVFPKGMKNISEKKISFFILNAYKYTIINSGNTQIHSAAVTYNNQAVAFCGLPGAGKSTQAHLWEEHLGASPLNLDQPCVIFEDEKTLLSGSPFSGKEDCYKNEAYPLSSIIFVEQAKENSIVSLSKAEAFSYLFLNNYIFPVNEEIEKKYSDSMMRLAKSVPCYKLKCTISAEAVMTVKNAVFGDSV